MKDKLINSNILSVIVPTYRRPELLQRAISSLYCQNIANLEVVIVDDERESSDVTEKVLLANRNSTIDIVYIKNTGKKGAASSRNLGVQVAKGRYITFLDDDDFILPGRYRRMLSELNGSSHKFVSTGRFYEKNDLSKIEIGPKQIFGNISLERINYANDIDIGFMLSKETFLAVGGFDLSLTNLEDWDFIIRLLKIGNGLKIEKFDYVVSIDSNRPRVSNDYFKGYEELLEKHGATFGKDWQSFMTAMICRLKNKYSLGTAIQLSRKFHCSKPLSVYMRFQAHKIKKIAQAARNSQ